MWGYCSCLVLSKAPWMSGVYDVRFPDLSAGTGACIVQYVFCDVGHMMSVLKGVAGQGSRRSRCSLMIGTL